MLWYIRALYTKVPLYLNIWFSVCNLTANVLDFNLVCLFTSISKIFIHFNVMFLPVRNKNGESNELLFKCPTSACFLVTHLLFHSFSLSLSPNFFLSHVSCFVYLFYMYFLSPPLSLPFSPSLSISPFLAFLLFQYSMTILWVSSIVIMASSDSVPSMFFFSAQIFKFLSNLSSFTREEKLYLIIFAYIAPNTYFIRSL